MPAHKLINNGICIIDGCGRSNLNGDRGRKGYCGPHYNRLLRYGDPLAGGTYLGEPQDWIARHLTHQRNDCLIWPFAKLSNGYASFRHEGKSALVHRHICERVNGPPPTPDHEAAHNCGRGSYGCVNPKHLEWKTRAENEQDKVVHGSSNRGERCGTSKLTEVQVVEIFKRVRNGELHKDIARDYGVSRSCVSGIGRGEEWIHCEALMILIKETFGDDIYRPGDEVQVENEDTFEVPDFLREDKVEEEV